ncbi:MAG: hypothetical protein ACFFCE_09885 [Promethearchaeota archaeon]
MQILLLFSSKLCNSTLGKGYISTLLIMSVEIPALKTPLHLEQGTCVT